MQERHTSKIEKCVKGNVLTTMPAVNLNVEKRHNRHLTRYVATNSVQVLSRVVITFWSSIVVLSPNGRFWYCAAIAFNERYTHVRTDEHKNTVATEPGFQLDRYQELDNVISLNVYCTTTADPFKRLPFPTPNKIQRTQSSELLTSLNQYTASACSTQNKPQKQAMAY